MKGEICLRIEGLMPEKLVERATAAGVSFVQLRFEPPHAIIVEVSERDSKSLLALCERFSLPVTVLCRRGRSAFLRHLAARWTLIPAVLVSIALCGLFLSRIWLIDIQFTGSAASAGRTDALKDVLDSLGVKPGLSNRLDTGRLSDELMSGVEGYSYIGARREGIRLLVEAAPEIPAPSVYDIDAPRDLIADRYGVVVAVNVEAGEACVSVGDVVQRGKMLIRGVERSAAADQRAIAALGEVIIRTWVEGTAEGRLNEAHTTLTGRQSVSAWLSSPWLTLPIVTGEGFAEQTVKTEVLPIVGLYLPVKLLRETALETTTQWEAVDEARLTAQLTALAQADARAALARKTGDACTVTKSWTRFTRVGEDILRAKAVYEIELNAAVPAEQPQVE